MFSLFPILLILFLLDSILVNLETFTPLLEMYRGDCIEPSYVNCIEVMRILEKSFPNKWIYIYI